MAGIDLVIERDSEILPVSEGAADEMQPSLYASEQYGSLIEFDPDGQLPRHRRSDRPARRGVARTGGFLYDGVRAGRAIRAGLSRRSTAANPVPMEEVLLYVKALDNSAVRREADPVSKAAWTRYVVVGFTFLAVMLFSYGPRAWKRHSGYRVASLEQEHQQLSEFNEQLKVRQAQLSDLRRVGELAGNQGFIAPPPERFAWQDLTIPPMEIPSDGVLASNWTFVP